LTEAEAIRSDSSKNRSVIGTAKTIRAREVSAMRGASAANRARLSVARAIPRVGRALAMLVCV